MYVLKTNGGCYDGIGQRRKINVMARVISDGDDTGGPPTPGGHHRYYPTLLLLTTDEGWEAIFPQLLAFSPLVNNSLAHSVKLLTVSWLDRLERPQPTQNISTMRVCWTASAVENDFLPFICISHSGIAGKWRQVCLQPGIPVPHWLLSFKDRMQYVTKCDIFCLCVDHLETATWTLLRNRYVKQLKSHPWKRPVNFVRLT